MNPEGHRSGSSARHKMRLPHPVPGAGAAHQGRRADARRTAGFLLRFLLGWSAALCLVSFVPEVERWAIHGTLQSLGFLSRVFTRSVVVANPDFVLGGTPVIITPDCTPLMPTAALWVAILAYPAQWRWKLTGLLVGAGLLWLYNLGRILITILVLKIRPEWFEFVHVYLWQTVTVIAVFGFFLLWLRLEPRRRHAP